MAFSKIPYFKSIISGKKLLKLYKSGRISHNLINKLMDDNKLNQLDFAYFLDGVIPDKNFPCTYQTTDIFNRISDCEKRSREQNKLSKG